MLHRILARLQEAILIHPGRVLAGSVALTGIALVLGLGVEFRTSRNDLSPQDDPEQQRLERLVGDFTGSSDLIACVEAAPGASKTPAELRAFADALAEAFRADPEVARVFHKIDLDWFLERGLHLVPPPMIRKAAAAALEERAALEVLAGVRDLADLNEWIARRLETGLAAAPSPGAGEDVASDAIGWLSAFLTWERRLITASGAAMTDLESAPPLLALAGAHPALASRGYLATHDGATLFLLVTPRSDDDSLPSLQRLVGAMRRRAGEVIASRPGFRVAFTGEPAITVEEMEAVRRDTLFTALVSGAGVTLLTLLVFRWKSHALLVLIVLAAGVTWSFGAVRLELGYLNLITSSFISTLVGVGVAYGIHPVSEYELEGAHTVDPVKAVRGAYRATGAAVTVGAVTTAAAFFSILLMRFRGFAELGLVAGAGVLLCLVASLVTLPALLVVYGRWRSGRDRSARAGPATAVVDRLWVERGAGRVCRYPRTATALALLLTAALGWAAAGVSFDTNILNLLPRNAESIRYQNRMILDSDLTPFFNVVVADDVGALRDLRRRSASEPAVDRFESALQFLPEDPEGSRAALLDLSERLDGIHLPDRTRSIGRERLRTSMQRLEEALGRASEAAFAAGLGRLAGPLEETRAEAAALMKVIEEAPAGAESAWDDAQRRLLAWAHRALEDLRRAARSESPGVADLPEEIRARFLTKSGRLLAFLHPAHTVFEQQSLERFVEASRRISPDAAGWPMVFRSMSGRITSGFYLAAGAAAALVLLILLADYRNFREAGFALVPLVMGVVWMMGGMRLLGLSYNFANLVTVPLIIGVGIDNGVHVIHRMRLEGAEGMTVVLRHTGRAILIAGLTTMIGFGSLALASHRGLASLGSVLLLGVGACLVTATVVLPNMLVAFGVARR